MVHPSPRLNYPRGMMRTTICLTVIALATALASCGAPDPSTNSAASSLPEMPEPPPTRTTPPDSLVRMAQSIETRGRQIASYQTAVIAAATQLGAMSPDPASFNTYVALESAGGWTVYFGKLNQEGSGFTVPYAFSCNIGGCAAVIPSADQSTLLPLARAVATASDAFTPRAEAYNTAIFTESNGSISVYLTPGSADPDIALLGGDYRISLSADGLEVIKVIELHRTVMEFPTRVPPGVTSHGTLRTNMIGELPTGTDVSFIIQNPHLAPHLVISETWASRISASGVLEILGTSEEILRDEAPSP